jgi:hypothetical protein
MNIVLYNNYTAKPDFQSLGYVGENKSRTIKFVGYKVDGASNYKIKFVYPDSVTYEADITSGTYTIPGSILRKVCTVECQIYAYSYANNTYTLVKKSNIFNLNIEKSLTGEPAAIPTYEEATGALEKLLSYDSTASQAVAQAKNYSESAESSATAALSYMNKASSLKDEARASANSAMSYSNAALSTVREVKQYAAEAKESAEVLNTALDGATVVFLTADEYEESSHNEKTVYFASDGNKITVYLGDVKLTGGTVPQGVTTLNTLSTSLPIVTGVPTTSDDVPVNVVS